ncbi:hypothetical protein M0R45_037675 [Rubus argutus]|uniref:F-box domain-containing protein n=1 Tax=Rubus argutus TaxID=59490 RepID=A0AAW1W2X5_RUBAR
MAGTEIMRKYCMRKKKELQTESMVDLPRDIFIDILMRLPLKTLGCLRCVSKTLLNKLDDPLINATIHMTLLTASEVPPLLMSVTRIELLGRVKMQPMKYDGNALKADKTKRVSLISPPTKPTLVKYHFDFCYYNLFFFKEATREHPCYLFDPLRGEVLKLPMNSVPVRDNFHRSYGMGFDTITKTHKIVCVSSNFEEDCLGV